MKILAIESSGIVASVAVMSDDILEGQIFLNHRMQHSVILFPMIQDILKRLDLSIDDIDAVAVSGGPGSFTGLRIGVAAAKGIAQGGDKKFVGVSTLDAIAFQQQSFNGIICPIMDALRDNVYTAEYMWKDGELVKIEDYDAVHINDVIGKLSGRNENVMFCGDGVHIHKDFIKEKLKDRAYFAAASMNMPSAASIAEIARIKLSMGICDSIYTFSPLYIRKSQAEREYERKNNCSV